MILKMHMRLLPLLLLLVGCPSAEAVVDTTAVGELCSGLWSSEGRSLYLGDDLVPTRVLAPNKMIAIQATRDALFVTSKAGQISGVDMLINPSLMEVLWSPDSRRFAFNVSDGGIVGSWLTGAYSLSESGGVSKIKIENEITKLANALPQCEEQEDANIGIVSWLAGGEELLLVAEVPPHSSCRNMGALQGFRVSVATGKIIEQISEKSLRLQWRVALGCRFSGSSE
jgi:hypothetical protein